MKTIKSISALLLTAAIFSGCAGDHSARTGKDTIQNSYQVTPDSAKLDTGVAKSPDNSANGGIYLVKRTEKAKRDSAEMAIK
jgi:PBP1b-binding outer membrane lipoprotein LpoB